MNLAPASVNSRARRQPRPNRRGEARGLHAFEVYKNALRALTYAWLDGRWALVADRRFPRGREPLALID